MAAGPDPAWVPVATLAGGRAVEPTCGLGYHTCPAIHKALLWQRAGAGRLPFAQVALTSNTDGCYGRCVLEHGL